MRISARNEIDCTVLSVYEGETCCIVRLALRDGSILSADMGIDSARDLGIREGMRVKALFKSSEVLISRAYPKSVSVDSRLEGRIAHIKDGATTSLVEVKLGDGQIVAAVVSTDSVDDLDLGVGDPVVAFVRDSAVMVGVCA